MPMFLEKDLKQEYGANSDIPYKIMNAKGYMHGNKETAKGRAADAKHASDEKKGIASDQRSGQSEGIHALMKGK